MNTFETSPNTTKLVEALAKVQGELSFAKKNAENPHFKSSYADLSSIWSVCREPLAKHGIFITQLPVHHEDHRAYLITRICLGEEWMQILSSIPMVKQDPHGFKSAITYLKRTVLEAALGIATEDDDGNEASKSPAKVLDRPDYVSMRDHKPETIEKRVDRIATGIDHGIGKTGPQIPLKKKMEMSADLLETGVYQWPYRGPSQGIELSKIPLKLIADTVLAMSKRENLTPIDKQHLGHFKKFLDSVGGNLGKDT